MKTRKDLLKKAAFTIFIIFISISNSNPITAATEARNNILLIRDSEIENLIREYTTPLFQVAGLNSESVHVGIINDPSLNAFVANGQNIFINTGLLTVSEDPLEIIGVLAHEIGHIAGGHLARTQNAINNSSTKALLGYILGAAALVVGGPEAGSAVLQSGSGIAQKSIARYSQGQEQAADQAALQYLKATNKSAHGLLKLFTRLEQQNLLLPERQNPYLQSHPLTKNRRIFVKNFIETSNYSPKALTALEKQKHRRMVAKLYAFINSPSKTFARYPETNKSLAARYARAIAYHKVPNLAKALFELDSLLDQFPNDPWFYELKGQILFENGKLQKCIDPYQKSTDLRPNEPLIRFGLARAQIELNMNKAAVKNLVAATRIEKNYAPYWHFLGIAYGRNKELNKSSLSFAEAALLRNNFKEALYYSERAQKGFVPESPGFLRAEDIRISAARAQKNR